MIPCTVIAFLSAAFINLVAIINTGPVALATSLIGNLGFVDTGAVATGFCFLPGSMIMGGRFFLTGTGLVWPPFVEVLKFADFFLTTFLLLSVDCITVLMAFFFLPFTCTILPTNLLPLSSFVCD